MKVTGKNTLLKAIEKGKERIDRLTGNKKLTLILGLSETAKFVSEKVAEEIIDRGLDLTSQCFTEEAALLLCEKAFFCFHKSKITDAELYAGRALKFARAIKSGKAEVKALTIKGYIDDVKGNHNKASAWYTIALAKCTRLQKPAVLLELGTSLSKQGAYAQAWKYMNEAIRLLESRLKDKFISAQEKLRSRKILIELQSRLGVLYESMGDYDESMRLYDESIKIAEQYNLGNLIYKAYSRKMKLMLLLDRADEAERCLTTAEDYLKDMDVEPRISLFLANDRARIYRASMQYEKALEKYSEILYKEKIIKNEDQIDYMIKYQADLFNEVLAGIIDSLYAIGKVTISESLSEIRARYNDIIRKFGIYEEFDKSHEIETLKNKLKILLSRIFGNRPYHLEYKGIEVIYEPDKYRKAVLVVRKTQKFHIATSYFFILKCFIDNIGECVTQAKIEESLKEHGEHIGGGIDSGVRTYINRLKKDYGFDQFIKKCPRGKGWRLIM
jgi:tetratricopeptide (TPR) repeat protein